MDETDQETSYQQLQRFLTSPLASWIRTLLPSGLDGADALSQYMQLVDGVLLNDVMVQIDPNPSNQRVNKGINGDVNLRIQNLAILVRHLKAYYQETLQQLVIMSPPDVLTIAKEPLSEKSLSEMQKLLLLLLGCAVQCNQKETYIEKIKLLDIDTQAAIVEHIQEVTQNQENILDVHWAELPEVPSQGLDSLARSLAYQVQRLVAERDEFSEVVMELTQERDYLQVQQACIQGQPERSSSPSSGGLSPGDTRQHLAVELADCKAKLRRLRQELEEKTEQLTDCKHEVTVSLLEIERLQQENLQLVGEARAARGYRDEADALRERSSRVERLESEVVRYRERLHDIDFYKTRMEEVHEDNVVLLETKAMLEEQLECSRSRCDGLHEAEKDNLQLRAKIHRLETERDSDRQRLEELLEENLALEFAQKQSMNESAQLGWELEQLNKSPDLGCRRQSVSTEVSEAASSRAIRLEKENHSLLQTIQELRASVQDGSPQLAKLEEEKRRLSIEVEELKESLKKEHPIIEHENLNDGEEGQPQEDVFQGGEQDGSGTGQRRVDRKSEREAARLDNMEQAHSRLQEQYFDLKQSLEAVRGLLARLGQEKTALEEENACLRRTVEGQRSAEARLAQAERERRELEDEQESLRRSLSSLQMEARRAERLESNVQSLATEKHRIQQALDSSAKKVAELEKELQVVEAKNHSLRRSVEELRIASRRLEHAEQASHTLESELAQSEKSRKQLDSENRRLRQQAEVREAGLEEATARVVAFEAENRAQGREMIRLGDVCTRFKEVEKENKELVKEITMDKKTLAMLREELVTEKLKVQNQNNELEKLNNELEKIGLNKEKLLQVAHSNDETKYQLLESKIESTQKKTLELREEKITALESRLEESSNLNQQLRQELKTVKKNYEALKQREEEERNAPATSPIPSRRTTLLSPGKAERDDATRELLRLKDRLIEIERNNATLQAEKQALKTQYKQLESQNNHLQTQILELQKQAVSLQEHNTSLQTQNAKLQVENSTLNSHNMSLTMQQTQLQGAQAILEAEADEVAKQHEMLKVTYDALLRDHERLAALHERQAADYEDLINRHGDLKTTHRLLEVENKDLEDRLNQLLKQKDQLVELETMLKTEREKMQQETRAHTAIAGEYQQLREENDRLNATYGRLRHEHESLFSEQKELKSELNSSRLHQARLEADCSDLRQQFQQLDVDSARLGSQCELLSHLKQKLEEENRHLLDQIQSLMQHNRDLLEHSMDSKDQFHQEQKQYIDKLNELRRQKEKLEEKIMDQYRFYSLSPPRRKSNWITTQMKKLMRPRKDGSRERLRSAPDGPPLDTSPSTHDGMDSSSVGSNSLDDIQGHHHTTARKSSTGTLQRLALRRNRARNRDNEEEKALHRRSMSMNDLGPGSQSVVTTPLPAVVSGSDAPLRERQLRSGSVDGLGDPEEPAVSKLRRRDLGCMAFSTSAMHMIAGSPSLTIHHGPEGLASSNDSVRSQRDLQSSQPTSSQTSLCASEAPQSKDGFGQAHSVCQIPCQLCFTGGFNTPESPTEKSIKDIGPNATPVTSQAASSASSQSDPTGTVTMSSLKPRGCRAEVVSPGSELVSLEEFLEESNRLSPTHLRKVTSREDILSDFEGETCCSEPVSGDSPGLNGLCGDAMMSQPQESTVESQQSGPLVARVSRPGRFVRPSPRSPSGDTINTLTTMPQSPRRTLSVAEKLDKLQQSRLYDADGRPPSRTGTLPRRGLSLRDSSEVGRIGGAFSVIDLTDGGAARRAFRLRSSHKIGAQQNEAFDGKNMQSGGNATETRSTDTRQFSFVPPRMEGVRSRPETSGVRKSATATVIVTPASPVTESRLLATATPPIRLQRLPPRPSEIALVSPVVASTSEDTRGCEDVDRSSSVRHETRGPASTPDKDKQDQAPQATSTPTDKQTVWYEYGCV